MNILVKGRGGSAKSKVGLPRDVVVLILRLRQQLLVMDNIRKVILDDDNFRYLPSRTRKVRHVALLAIGRQNPWCFVYVHRRLQMDRSFILQAIEESRGGVFKYLDEELRDDYELAAKAIQFCPMLLLHASPRLRADYALVRSAIERNGKAFHFALQPVIYDRELVLLAARNRGHVLRRCHDDPFFHELFQDDEELVLCCVEINGLDLRFASDRLREDPCLRQVAANQFFQPCLSPNRVDVNVNTIL